MRTGLADASREIRAGTSVGLTLGAFVGFALGASLVSLRYAPLLFDNLDTKVVAVVLLTSGFALTCAGILLPLELAVAGVRWRWPDRVRLRSRRVYAGGLLIALASLHIFLWVALRQVRDIAAPASVGIWIGIGVAALTLLVLIVRLGRRDTPADTATDARVLGFRIVLLTALCFLCVRYLDPRLGGTPHSPTPPRAWPAGTLPATTSGRRPNVILVSIDSLRSDHLPSYGYDRDTTPNLDRLAQDVTVFLDARSHSPWTLPSHATMFTATYPVSNGVRFFSNFRLLWVSADRLAGWNLTLAEVLQAAGYRTGAVTSVPWVGKAFGLDQGFDYIETQETGHDAATVVDKGRRWIGEDATKPFFLFLHLFDVHEYRPTGAFKNRYTDPGYHGPVEGHPARLSANLFQTLDDDDLNYARGLYDDALRSVDAELGRLIQFLREDSRYDDSIIIVTSDHGEEFWDHGGTGHGFTLYEEMLRVPLIVKPPRGALLRHHQRHGLAGLIDIAPTILDYAGLPPVPAMQGISLRPLIERDAPPPPRALHAGETYLFNTYAIIDPVYKYIEHRVPPEKLLNAGLLLANLRAFYRFDRSELYRIGDDPAETRNLIDVERDAGARLRAALFEHVRHASRGESIVIDDETRERLRSLGYLR